MDGGVYLPRIGRKMLIAEPDAADIVILATTGRTSGRRRETPVIAVTHPTGWVVTASNSGHDHHPDWYRNLEADPVAQLRLGRHVHDVTARVTTGDERDQLWAQVVEVFPDYNAYRQVTDRQIPVVVLERTPPAERGSVPSDIPRRRPASRRSRRVA